MKENPSEPNGNRNGEPDAATTLRYCRKCAADVLPVGKGKCPRCGTFLRLNYVARRHPVNVFRKDALFVQLLADFQPTDTLGRSRCEHLAGTLEQLEVMKAGSQEWRRLVDVAEMLGATLQDAKAARLTAADAGIEEELERLTTAQLADRVEAQARQLRAMADEEAIRGAVTLPADSAPSNVDVTEPADADPVPEHGDCPAPTAVANPDADRARRLAELSPRRTNAEATAEMLAQIGAPRPSWWGR